MANTTIRHTSSSGFDDAMNLATSSKEDPRSRQRMEQARAEDRAIYEYKLKQKYAKLLLKDEKAARDKINEELTRRESYLRKQELKSFESEFKKIHEETMSSWKKGAVEVGKSLGVLTNRTFKDSALSAVSNITNGLTSGIDKFLGMYSQYMSGIETRLYGSGKSYSSISKMIGNNIGASQYVSQTKMYDNLSKLVEQGIAYNVEQRAFLQTVSEKIATTFDAANGTLLQLIRIQQSDSTAARLGLESTLTSFLNNMFGDTSYLNGTFDTVSANLLGANSLLTRNQSAEFEYVIQKWLGSLGSVGVSDSTLSSLAQGLNYLGTGNIEALNGNMALQRLLVMAANNSGLNYSDLLTGGLNANNANAILGSLVSYIQQISAGNNNVVKSQFANLFGVTLSDMSAIMNLTSKDLVSISSNMLTYQGMIEETNDRLATLASRTSMKERIDTLFENVMASVGENIGNNAAVYTTWLINDLVEKATGGINIPFISAMGSGIDLNANVNQILKLGIVGISTLSEIGTIMSGLSGRNNLSLNKWGAEEFNNRYVANKGLGFTSLSLKGTTTSTSQTAYIGNSNSDDMYTGSIAHEKEKAQETFGGDEEESENVNTILKEMIHIDLTEILSEIRSMNDNIEKLPSQIKIW